MMYIEHTALEDNLHHILTNRVPTSSSPSATEAAAAAVAASALLARVREAQNSASSLNALQVPKTNEHQPCSKEWLRRPEPKLVPVGSLSTLDIVKHLTHRPKETQNGVLDHLAKEDEAQEEEQFELVHIDDCDQQETQAAILEPIEVQEEKYLKSKDDAEDNSATTHFLIDIHKETGLQNRTDDEEEFEYVVTRVPKKRSHHQSIKLLHPPKELDDHQTTSQTSSQRSQSSARPVPGAIPLDLKKRKLLNGSLPALETERRSPKGNNANSVLEALSGPEDCDYYSDLETVEAASVKACDNENRKKDVQMGLDILNKLRQIFNWNPSSNHYDTGHQEGKRKRRSEDYSGESTSDHLIKYRKVENRFPKYVAHTEEDDVIQFLPPPPPQSNKQFLSNNMSARRSPLDKPPLRKSMFSAPQITKQLIKNTSYADIEFSDDDEPQMVYPSTSAAVRRVPKSYNIPIMRPDEHTKSMQQKPPPALIEPRTGSILSSSQFSDVSSVRRPTYADALRQNNPRVLTGRTGNVLGTRNSSISSSGGASTSESLRFLNGFSSLRTNHWSNITRSSILAQEKESEEREKYQQLLEQVVPRLYGSSVENKIPTNAVAQRRRSGLLLAAATSSTRSSPANNRRSLGLNQSILKRPPLSSTINLDDDEDDITFSGTSHLKSTCRVPKGRPSLATVIIDDDDISDIIDLDNTDRHVLSQCAKIRQEENSINHLCADKPKAPKKKALPYVEPVNSFQERISASPHIKENWLENLQSKWSLRKRNRLDEVKETFKVAEKLTSERRAAEAEIHERLRTFQIVDPELLVVDDFEDLIPEPEFVELSREQKARINAAICGPPDQILVSKFNLNITRRDIHTLCGHNWLNDEVINFYMNLLTERGEVRNKSQGLPSVYAMNTFFVPRLIQAGHGGVKRWTRKVDIFAKDILPVPVHVGGVHWCMAIIHIKNRTIKYYDSMGTPNPTVLKALEQYLKDESLDKRKQPFDTSGFRIESVQGVPRQMNGSDCGVFSCMFAEYITRDKEITFSQQNMEYFRQKMVLEIVTGELLQ